MAALTFANVETRMANRLRIPTSNSTEMTKLDAVINDIVREMSAKYVWPWLLKRQLINTVAVVETGTVSVTKGSTSATLSATYATSLAEKVLHIPGNAVETGLYRISTHTAATDALTLASAYTGATDTAAAYKIWSDEYDLATDFGEIRYVRRFGYTEPIRRISPQDMQALKAYDRGEGPPQMYALFDFDTSGDPSTVPQFVVHPFPDDTYQLELHYKQTLATEYSGSTVLPIPQDHFHVLEWGILSIGYIVFLNDPSRATYFRQLYGDALNLMVVQQRAHDGLPQIVPVDCYRGFYHRGRRFTPANADLGNYFDRYPSSY